MPVTLNIDSMSNWLNSQAVEFFSDFEARPIELSPSRIHTNPKQTPPKTG